jgi:hypothetical protein
VSWEFQGVSESRPHALSLVFSSYLHEFTRNSPASFEKKNEQLPKHTRIALQIYRKLTQGYIDIRFEHIVLLESCHCSHFTTVIKEEKQ